VNGQVVRDETECRSGWKSSAMLREQIKRRLQARLVRWRRLEVEGEERMIYTWGRLFLIV
jgi:hypothetical protein